MCCVVCCAALVLLLLPFFAFFHFLLSVCCLTKITRYMHSRNVCVFFSLSVYYDVVVGAVVMATACDAACRRCCCWTYGCYVHRLRHLYFFLFAPIVEICTLIFVAHIRKHMHCISCSTTFFSFFSFFTFVQSTVYCRCPVHSIASTTQHQLCSKIAKRDRSTYCWTLFFLMSICDAVLRQFVVSVLIRFVFFLFILFSASLMPCCYFL